MPVDDLLPTILRKTALPFPLPQHVSQMRCSLVNRYQRKYFLSADRCFRLTVDTDLEFVSPVKGKDRSTRDAPFRRQIIVELKYPMTVQDKEQQVMRNLPFRLIRMSKYVAGVQYIGV